MIETGFLALALVWKLAVSLFVLGVLIFVHELGHFLVAKLCGVGVLEFAIGFGRSLITAKVGATTYNLRLIPLGGFVRMVGDDPRFHPDTVADNDDLSAEEKALFADKSKWFLEKGLWAKSAIVFAGPFFNIVFAFLVSLVSIATLGFIEAVNEPKIGQTIPGYPAEKAGLKANDVVRTVNGSPVSTWDQMASLIHKSAGEKLTLSVSRAGSSEVEVLELEGQEESGELAILNGRKANEKRRYMIGIMPAVNRVPVALDPVTLVSAAGFTVYIASERLVSGLWGMVTGVVSTKKIGGPIFILQEASKQAERGLGSLFDFVIMLSVSLAVLNLLPIPILDGGHLLFFFLEAIIGSPLSVRVVERAQQVGMALLLLLMVFAMGNDIQRLAGW